MTDEDVEHEIVHFRRQEIADLRSMPSASGQQEMLHSNRPTHRLARLFSFAGLGLVGLVVAVWLGVTLVGSSGPVSRLLQTRVEAAVRQALGPSANVTMGPARLSFDGAQALAVQLDDFQLARTPGNPGLQADELSVGIRLLPLLAGRLELSNARVAKARLELGEGGDKPAWLTAISDADGLINPDRIGPAAFSVVQRLTDLSRRGGGSSLTLEDVSVITGGRELIVRDLLLSGTGPTVAIDGTVALDGTDFLISGTTASAAGLVDSFTLAASNEEADEGSPTARASIAGTRPTATGKSTVRLSLLRLNNELDFGPRGKLRSDVDLMVRAAEGEGKIEIERLVLHPGDSSFRFTGAVGRLQEQAGAPAYRFELISNESLIAPEESTEATMPAAIRLAGAYTPSTRQIDLADIRVRASSGEAVGSALFVLGGPGQSPAMKLDLGVRNMDVAQVKQLWPWMAAGNARRWVMKNFFGGQVLSGRVNYDIAAGRLQIRKPLNAKEVSGQFDIRGSRFDTAGVLPAVRDAVGSIMFAGERVEVSLASGRAFVGEGQQLSLSDGKLIIADTQVRPLIARMDMNFEGAAETVAQVASLEPLNAMRGIDLAPADLDGSVKGHVSADIPLQKGVDPNTLDWDVQLTYRGLAIAKPIQGQKVDQADGTLRLQPDRATIEAKGRLNSIPAEFALVQPIRGSSVPVKRDVTLVFGDKERAAMAPALNTLMSGPVKLRLDASSQAVRKISADLTQTRLTIPWAGWSKGAGIAANATLDLLPNGQVRDLRLEGKSFSARGSIDMSGGSFRTARFDSLALNPGDNVAMTVKRDGNTYAINLTGQSIDGRVLIKQLYEQGGSSSAKATVALTAEVDAIQGFNDETLRNAKIRYRGNAAGGGSASVSGIVGRNASFSIDDERAGGSRRVSVSTADAGSLLRLLNVYSRMEGGSLQLSLSGDDTLRGQVELRNFNVINEPRLGSVVSSSAGGTGSLDEATKSRIDTNRVQFQRAFAQLTKGPGSLRVDNAVLRGPVIGTTFEGTVYDADNRMNISGTFMPAYGLNSIFGDIPLLGAFLGGGPDGGLIGVTYRLRGSTRSPTVEVNPLSAIAPGIFRKIFEY